MGICQLVVPVLTQKKFHLQLDQTNTFNTLNLMLKIIEVVSAESPAYNTIFKFKRKHVSVKKTSKHFMIGRKSQLLISEGESLAESFRKYRCLYGKFSADNKNKVLPSLGFGR